VEQAFLYTETAIKEIATCNIQIGGSNKGTISNIKQKVLRMTCLVVEGIAGQEALGKERVAVTFQSCKRLH
jgi:hypothetical protein